MARVFQNSAMLNAAGRPAWCLDFTDLNGKRNRERTNVCTKAEAEKILRDRLEKIEEAKRRGVSTVEALRPLTFAEFVEKEFLPHHKASVRESTYITTLGHYENVKPHFGGLLLSMIGARDLKKWRAERLEEKTQKGRNPTPATANRERTFLMSVMQSALEAELIDRNPVLSLKPLKEDGARDRWLTREEFEKLMEKAPEWLRPIMEVAVYTGMRESEITSLQWSALDWRNGFIRIGTESKSHKARHPEMTSPVRAVLKAQSPCIGPEGRSPYVFTNPETGTAYKSSSVSHSFADVVEEAGLEDVCFHTLRHTFASWAIQAGIPKEEVRRALGHSSDSMTQRYAHLAPQTSKKGLFEKMLGGLGVQNSGTVQPTVQTEEVGKPVANLRAQA